MKTNCKNNQEPQVGDLVQFKADDTKTTYTIVGVQNGKKLGSKISIVPVNNPQTFSREYTYNLFVKVGQLDQPKA